MKKFVLPLFCAMLALTSCLKESTFTMNNYTDYATNYKGVLVTDGGSVFTVVENGTGSDEWKTEGARMFILCDVLNRSLDIRLKDFFMVNVQEPLPLNQLDKEPDDPIEVLDTTVSGGYLNLGVKYYYNPAGNYARQFHSYWEEDGTTARLYLFYDGNHESPAYFNTDQLKQKEEMFSLSLKHFIDSPKTFSSISITLYELKDKTVEKNTYPIYMSL